MPRLWPDPRDNEPEHPAWLWGLIASLGAVAILAIYRMTG